jgi:hypothetical protein
LPDRVSEREVHLMSVEIVASTGEAPREEHEQCAILHRIIQRFYREDSNLHGVLYYYFPFQIHIGPNEDDPIRHPLDRPAVPHPLDIPDVSEAEPHPCP